MENLTIKVNADDGRKRRAAERFVDLSRKSSGRGDGQKWTRKDLYADRVRERGQWGGA